MTLLSRYENSNITNKEIFSLWLKLGTLTKVSLYLEKQGIVSVKNGKAYGVVTLSRYAWRYILEYPEEAHQVVIDNGTDISDEYWEQLLVRRAYAIYVGVGKNRQKFYNWLEKNNLEEYRDYKTNKDFFREDSGISTVQEQMLIAS